MQAQNLELLRNAVNRPDISSTLLQVLERGMAIAGEARADSEGGWLGQVARIAREVLPSMAEMARARAAMPPPPGAIPLAGGGAPPPALLANAPPSPGPGPNGAPAPAPSPGPGIDLDDLVRGYAPAILDAVRAGTPADDVADTILGYLPPALLDELEPLTAERAIRVAPALSQHRGYVEQIVSSLKDALREDDGPEAA
jgi:hypothetical protein